MNMELKKEELILLENQDDSPYVKVLLILYATIYDQDLMSFLQDYQLRLTMKSQERLFAVANSFKDVF